MRVPGSMNFMYKKRFFLIKKKFPLFVNMKYFLYYFVS